MIKQIRLSLVDLYIKEDVMNAMYSDFTTGGNISHMIAIKFNMYRAEKTKANKITMTKEQLDDRYYRMLQENVLALKR